MLVVCFLYRSFNTNRLRRSRDLYDEPGSLQESNSDAETYWIKAAFSASTTAEMVINIVFCLLLTLL